jgi:ATP-dependent helicase/nuclease subunit A
MNIIGHVMILASAGSGKTYALTNRFVRLLALGAKPERIVALTFTRKAAGEFFDEILNKVAHASEDQDYAAQLAVEIGVPLYGCDDFLRMLRTVVDAMHRLRLGTFDGFFARIARNFPLELGLTGEFEILQEHGARMERSRVLRRIFERAGELADAQREFIEAFKRATFGVEEKRLGAQLDTFLDQHQEIFLGVPERSAWGNSERIWPKGSPWLAGKIDANAVRVLREWVEVAGLPDKQRLRWADFLEAWEKWNPGVVPTRPLAYVLEKALDAWSDLQAGRAVLEFDRKPQTLTPAACSALADLTRHVVGSELQRRLEVTQGIHAVVAGYEAVYHDAVRRAGKLTFGDVQRLLVPRGGIPQLGSGSSFADEDDTRLVIDYRLDGEIDHWLLDEFQDTSFGQWSVLRNLIDEAVQDPTGARSFFYVGDVKQAIFAWRDGDPRLFREIFDHYNNPRPGTIAEEHLVKSWRSGPAVIEAVNQVFGDAAVLNELFPGVASTNWNREWRAHESAKPTLSGQVALLHAPDEASRFEVTLELLRTIEPLKRGLTCALLVQDNQTAAKLADYLRRVGQIPAVAEADLHVCTDNPVGSALLALVQVAAHPGDTLAWQHLQMTPFGALLERAGLTDVEKVSLHILGGIHEEGFERMTTTWWRKVEPLIPADDAFSRQRARQFTQAAALFDATGSRDVAEFVQFMERHTVRDAETAAVLRVMTIHKSKGLGFDVVLLPDVEGIRIDCRREGLAVQKSPDRTVEWVLDLPGKLFHTQDDVLSAHVRSAEAEACYESLSLLYVAMTRAKRAMYLITKPPGTSTSRNFPKLLAETLGEESSLIRVGTRDFGGAFMTGEAGWFLEDKPSAGNSGVQPIPVILDSVSKRLARLPARRPSQGGEASFKAGHLFSLTGREAAGFGLAVHALLAEVEWVDGNQATALSESWRKRSVPAQVTSEVMACLRSPALVDVWKPRESAVVWRERAFEVVMEGAWFTGVFDRVVIEYEGKGSGRTPVHAVVYDFKTEHVDTGSESLVVAASRHAEQLHLYRRVVALLLGLSLTQVTSKIIFTRLAISVGLDPVSG